MTSLSLINNITSKQLTGTRSFAADNRNRANEIKEQGNEFLKQNELDKAIECYLRAIAIDPNFADAYFNLGKAYNLKKQYKEAAQALEKAKELNPNDIETIIVLGESYKHSGQYNFAIRNFETALQKDNTSDYAKRNLEETKNLYLAVFNPKTALEAKKAQAQKNLNDAISIAKNYLPKGYLKDMSDLAIAFDTTNEMGGRSNIAQYEHAKRKITITGDYIWANPRIVGAYLVHEFVHAKDNDPYTSITEEQDAYEEAAKFWTSKLPTDTQPPVKDPEMDYVAELYLISPQKLKDRVAEIYTLRDPQIAKTSPNHPPQKIAASSSLSDDINAQSLRKYDIIA